MQSATPCRRRWSFLRLLQFRLQTLLLLTALAAVLVSWWLDRQRLLREIAQVNDPGSRWGVVELLGPPDTAGYGDITTAWASATQDGQPEWLELEYASAVAPAAIEVHETYNPGAVYQISLFDSQGREHIVWRQTPVTPGPPRRNVLVAPVTTQIRGKRVKVYLASDVVPGWNEIDTVGLTDGRGRTQWPVRARASSEYANSAYAGEWRSAQDRWRRYYGAPSSFFSLPVGGISADPADALLIEGEPQ